MGNYKGILSEAGGEKMAGKLYLVATPIGNLEDITYRALRTLREADLIGAEDTRHSIKLLNHFDIKTPMTSYHEYNKVDKTKYLVGEILSGKNVAIVTDAGTPGISDPGEEIVKQCFAAGIEVSSIPGPAACITALTMSGQNTKRFAFEAFLPYYKKERAQVLSEIKNETRTIIIYEAPHHLLRTLEELYETVGDRSITLCKELTKIHENAEKTTISAAIEKYTKTEPKGEYVLVIEGKPLEEIRNEEIASFSEMTVEEHMEMYMSQGTDKKEAMKMVAKDRGVSKRDIYDIICRKE